ncbi:hypothetical protein HPP92_019244 [Vanilla planifolia]|uniref:NAC domain-containing protein n=1 Tax=Vanilla planifolia TaxID=51239 RepID=A0A835Q2I5_VANPL|nr:hypothetical protein HPP92_019244 [Vanilla planifolia]
MPNGSPPLPPGFRFHPTDEELILHYLCRRAASEPCPASVIAEVDIYKFNPWDLPDKAKSGDREWYFFSPRDRKYPNGVRPNRTAASGYWKATGTDKPITTGKGDENIGVKKALVFYTGKPPKGVKTNWIMHEYRLQGRNSNSVKRKEDSMRLDDWVLCRIYQKTSHHPPAAVHEEEADSPNKSFCFSELLLEEGDVSLFSRLLDTPTIAPTKRSRNISSREEASSASDTFVDSGSNRKQKPGNLYFGTFGHIYKPNSIQFDQVHTL